MPLFSKNCKVIELHPENFDLINSKVVHKKLRGKKGMVAFMANFCIHCKRLSPVYEEVANSLGDSFPMFFFDCEKYSAFTSQKLNISGFPTVKYLDRDGKISKDYNGNREKQEMIKNICTESKVCR